MNKLFFLIIFIIIIQFIYAQNTTDIPQEIDLFIIPKDDLDSLFEEPAEQTQAPPTTQTPSNIPAQTTPKTPAKPSTAVISDIRKRGIEFTAGYNFKGIFNPGYEVLPWDIEEEEISYSYGAEMKMSMTTNAQISENFRVKNEIIYEIPGGKFELGDFFFDYNILNRVFFRAGKFKQSWGVSPNFAFTNLLARLATQMQKDYPDLPTYDPDAVKTNGTSYIMKADIPIGIGGIQVLALTRADLANVHPKHNYIGYGSRFSLAFNWAEFNLGIFKQDYMATRTYLSAKTNIFKTDIYSEFLMGINDHTDNSIGYGANLGFTKSLFNNKLSVNAEYYYNGEERTLYFSPETDYKKEESLPFLEEHNFAFNILYRFDGKINPRVFANFVYGDDSFSLTAGLRLTPLSNIDVYLAAKMAMGDGYYYKEATDYFNEIRPFRIMLVVSFSGSVRVSKYY